MSFGNHVLLAILLDSVHFTPEEIENAIMAGHFGFVIEENYGRVITLLFDVIVFQKLRAYLRRTCTRVTHTSRILVTPG